MDGSRARLRRVRLGVAHVPREAEEADGPGGDCGGVGALLPRGLRVRVSACARACLRSRMHARTEAELWPASLRIECAIAWMRPRTK